MRRRKTPTQPNRGGLVSPGMAVALVLCSCGSDPPDPLSPLEESLVGAVESYGAQLDLFWSQKYPTFGQGKYRSPEEVVPYQRGTVPDVGCGISDWSPKIMQRNAFYCPEDDQILYEIDFLLEEGRQFGALVSLLVMAHEWGHHIQHLAGRYGEHSLGRELGADCFAGISASYLDEQGLLGEDIGDAPGTLQTAAASVFLKGRDYPNWNAPKVHGTPRERVVAFATGVLTDDPRYCLRYERYEPGPALDIGGGYRVDPLPGTVAETTNGMYRVTVGNATGVVLPLSDVGDATAIAQLPNVLAKWFDGRSWQPEGEAGDSGPDATFGGSTAVQPYSGVQDGEALYGAVVLHVASPGHGLLVDVNTKGALTDAGTDEFQPIGNLMYTILKHTCPPATNEVSCLHPLGLDESAPGD